MVAVNPTHPPLSSSATSIATADVPAIGTQSSRMNSPGTEPTALQPAPRQPAALRPRALPSPAPERITFSKRLVLKKLRQSDGVVMYVTHIKGKPTFLFMMEKLDPATAVRVSGFLPGRRALVVADRDGVVKDSRFLNEVDKQQAADVMIPSALEACKRLNEAGIGFALATNQGGYETNKMSFEDTLAINVRVIQQIADAGGHVDAVFICPFTSGLKGARDGVYDARKPSPGMPLYAKMLAERAGVPTLAMVGDQRTDGGAAQAAGLKFYAVTDKNGRWVDELVSAQKKGEALPELDTSPEAYKEQPSLADAVDDILSQFA